MIRLFSAVRRGQVLSVTDRAASKLHEMMQGLPSDVIGIKLSLKKKGCSGMGYSIDYAKSMHTLDEVVKFNTGDLIIDAKAVMFVAGMTIDFSFSAVAEEFVFSNPNAKGVCGCGKSFTV